MRGGIHQQNGQRGEVRPGTRFHGLRDKALVRATELFPDHGLQRTEARVPDFAAERGGRLPAAGEEEGGLSRHQRRNGVTGPAVGRAEHPILPGLSQTCGEQLDAGEARQDTPGDPRLAQQAEQAIRAGIEARIAAEDDAGVLRVRLLQTGRDFLRARCRDARLARDCRQALEQTPGAQHQPGLFQSSLCL